MAENKNLKSLNERMKKRPLIGEVARFAGISQSHLANIVAGRRKASPELKKKIETGYRRISK
jgi:plasmid maintenance system antidote protein VapI